MKTTLSLALLSISLLVAPSAMAQRTSANEGLTEAVQRVVLSRGGDLNVLISKRTGSTPSIAVLLFPGYPGILKLKEESGSLTYDLAGNFV